MRKSFVVLSLLMGNKIFSALLSVDEVLDKLIFWSRSISYIFSRKLGLLISLVFELPMAFTLTLPWRIFMLLSVVWLNFPVKQIGTFKLFLLLTSSQFVPFL